MGKTITACKRNGKNKNKKQKKGKQTNITQQKHKPDERENEHAIQQVTEQEMAEMTIPEQINRTCAHYDEKGNKTQIYRPENTTTTNKQEIKIKQK